LDWDGLSTLFIVVTGYYMARVDLFIYSVTHPENPDKAWEDEGEDKL
jgi:hypothetical protein